MTHRVMKSFPQRLRALRKKAGLTQEDIAKHLGLNQATYSAMERGSQKILSDYLFQIADLLDIPIWQVFVDPDNVGALNEEDQAFFDMWRQFDSFERELLNAIAKQIMRKKELEMFDTSLAIPEASSKRSPIKETEMAIKDLKKESPSNDSVTTS